MKGFSKLLANELTERIDIRNESPEHFNQSRLRHYCRHHYSQAHHRIQERASLFPLLRLQNQIRRRPGEEYEEGQYVG